MIRLIPVIIIVASSSCRDRVDRDKLEKATALAGAPMPATDHAAPACPAGSELMGAPRPRGSGRWCQQIADGRIRVFRTDGTLWAEGGVDGSGLQGEVRFFAPDGRVALVRSYANHSTQGDDDVRIPGIELPPTILSVCNQDPSKPPSTTPCP